MSLLLQVLGGALEGAGTTGADLMTKDYEAQLQAQRDQAQAVRDQNLENLRAQNTAAAADIAFSRVGDTEKARQMNTLSSSLRDGAPDTNQGIADAVAANGKYKSLLSSLNAAGDAKDHADNQEAGPPVPDNIPGNRPGNVSDEDKSALADLQAKGGTITNPSLDMKQAQMDLQQKVQDAKNETTLEKAKMYTDLGTYKSDLTLKAAQERLEWAKTNGLTGAIKESQIAVQKAEEERKNATAASKLLSEGDFSKPDVVNLYNKFMTGAGMPEAAKPAPEVKPDKPKSKGMLASIFGGGDTPAAAVTPEVIDNRDATGKNDTYNFSALPKGSQPVPGQFTKDGRPVFKAPNGQLVAPQLAR